MSSVILKNIGTIVSGDISEPILKGNAIFVEDGIIKKAGDQSEHPTDTWNEVGKPDDQAEKKRSQPGGDGRMPGGFE